MKKIVTPFEDINKNTRLLIVLGWIVVLLAVWFISSMGERHLFPSPQQVLTGISELYNEGLVVHIVGLFFSNDYQK